MRRKNILDTAVEKLRAAEQIREQIQFCQKEPMWKSYVPTDTRTFRRKLRHWTQRIYAKTCMLRMNLTLTNLVKLVNDHQRNLETS